MNAKTTKRTELSLGIMVTLLLVSCATSPDSKAFQQYASAVQTAGDGVDLILQEDVNWSRDAYIDGVLDGSIKLKDTAFLGRRGPFTAVLQDTGGTNNEPIFYRLQDARTTLIGLNTATEKYVNLLAQLAGSDLIDSNTFQSLAKETDTSLNTMVAKLNTQVPGNAIHVFSVASAEIFKLIIENKRHQALEKLLLTNQMAMDSYCSSCVDLLGIMDRSLASDYNVKAHGLENDFSNVSKETGSSNPKARTDVEQLLQLNADYLTVVKTLKSANSVYLSLPKGHQELLESVQKKPGGLTAIQDLFQEGEQMKSMYDELNQPPTTTSKKG